jgi:hypothetical protein
MLIVNTELRALNFEPRTLKGWAKPPGSESRKQKGGAKLLKATLGRRQKEE